MYCKYCGSKLDDDATFCNSCGRRILSSNSSAKDNKKQGAPSAWYYIESNAQQGPVSTGKILELIRSGKILSDTPLWKKEFPDWVLAENTVFRRFLVEAELNRKHVVSDKWLWALATVPLTVGILLFQLGFGEAVQTIAMLVLNIIFLTADTAYLNSEEIKIEKWIYLGFVLIPLYMFIRSSKTNKNYTCAIVWCIFFIATCLPIW